VTDGYSENPGSVRVDYFKAGSSKWYMTEAVDMTPAWNTPDLFDAVRFSLNYHWVAHHGGHGDGWQRFTVVVLHPYHRNGYPVMLRARETW
jgi:hypothetical protein